MYKNIDNIIDVSLWNKLDDLRGFSSLGSFISRDSQILLANIIYQIKEIKKSDKLLYIEGGSEFFYRDFLFSKIPNEHIKVRLPEKIDIKPQADLVFGYWPFNAVIPGYKTPIDRIDTNNQKIIECVDAISKDGIGVFLTLPYHRTFKTDDLRKHLDSKEFFVNGIINLPKNFLMPQTQIQPMIIVVSRAKTDKEFILQIDSSTAFDFSLENLFNKVDSDDISVGMWIEPSDFEGFEHLEISKEINSLGGDYLNLPSSSLEEICKEINIVKTGGEYEEKDDAVYVPLIGNQEAITDIYKIPIKHQNYAQLVVDETRILPEYLCSFLNSRIGKKLLDIEKVGAMIPRITKSKLKMVTVRLPKMNSQQQVAEVVAKYKLIRDEVEELGKNITLNPISDTDTTETIDLILQNIGKLSASDQIFALIRNGEDKKTEFKQTYCMDIKTKKKETYITKEILKAIAAFLNTEGGNLLIGVSDSKEITGMKFEMEKLFKQGSSDYADNLMKTLANLIKDRIGQEFSPLINPTLVPIQSDYILRIECTPSDKEVFIDKEFWMRLNPASTQLEGQKLLDYTKRRFWQ